MPSSPSSRRSRPWRARARARGVAPRRRGPRGLGALGSPWSCAVMAALSLGRRSRRGGPRWLSLESAQAVEFTISSGGSSARARLVPLRRELSLRGAVLRRRRWAARLGRLFSSRGGSGRCLLRGRGPRRHARGAAGHRRRPRAARRPPSRGPGAGVDRRAATLEVWDRAAEALGGDDGPGERRSGKHDHEPLASGAGDDVRRPRARRECCGDAAQDGVARRVAERVVDPLEMVDVDQGRACG